MTKIEKAFDIAAFREQGYALIDALATHLTKCHEREGKVLSLAKPEDEYQYWKHYTFQSPEAYHQDLIQRGISLHHPRYMGHQVSAPAPLAALTGLLSELTNNGMGVYEMGASGTAIERVVVEDFCKHIGYDVSQSGGIMTSGGTLANLTGLLAARASFRKKHGPKETPFILVSREAHFCAERAAMTMGFAPKQVVKIDVNPDFTMDIDQLSNTIEQLKESGKKVMTIVSSNCNTSTGAYDDIQGCADLCDEHDIWLHIDGAHGGGVIYTQKYKHLCAGIERADSVVIDAHKMMLTPALATVVAFQKESDSYKALDLEASYLMKKNEDEWWDLAKRTYETTKYMMATKVFGLLQQYGPELIDEYITRQYDLTKEMAAEIHQLPNLEVGHEPQSNILCFRYVTDQEQINEVNAQIRKQLLEDGNFYIVQTKLHGDHYLRVTLMNPHTTMEDVRGLLDEVERIALAMA